MSIRMIVTPTWVSRQPMSERNLDKALMELEKAAHRPERILASAAAIRELRRSMPEILYQDGSLAYRGVRMALNESPTLWVVEAAKTEWPESPIDGLVPWWCSSDGKALEEARKAIENELVRRDKELQNAN